MGQKTIKTGLVKVLWEEKKSKFWAHLFPYALYEETLQKLKEEHPKAVHFVSAYRTFNEQGQLQENAHDDGEPRGSSGRPSLNVLIGHELVAVALITVRYFGGTKLGVGGLVRAYSDAANSAIDAAVKQGLLTDYKVMKRCELTVPYAKLKHLIYLLEKAQADIKEKVFLEDKVIIKAEIAEQYCQNFLEITGEKQHD